MRITKFGYKYAKEDFSGVLKTIKLAQMSLNFRVQPGKFRFKYIYISIEMTHNINLC